MNRKLPVEFSGWASPLNLPGDRLTFLTTALRSFWFEDRKFQELLEWNLFVFVFGQRYVSGRI
jgi:hypothetical protein